MRGFCVCFVLKEILVPLRLRQTAKAKLPVNQLLVSSYGAVMKITFSSPEISLGVGENSSRF